MPRRARFIIDDGIYHVMIRGNNHNRIFDCDYDFKYFLELIKEAKFKFEIKIYHYVLMDNHVHLIIKSQKGINLSEAMKKINVSYTSYYRRRYGGIGHFFQDRFKSYIIQDGKYLLECGRYVELNPVKAGIVKFPDEYKWSSYHLYAEGIRNDLVDKNPEYDGLSDNKANLMNLYKMYVKDGISEQVNEDKCFREGIYGSDNFKSEMYKMGLKRVSQKRGRPRNEK